MKIIAIIIAAILYKVLTTQPMSPLLKEHIRLCEEK